MDLIIPRKERGCAKSQSRSEIYDLWAISRKQIPGKLVSRQHLELGSRTMGFYCCLCSCRQKDILFPISYPFVHSVILYWNVLCTWHNDPEQDWEEQHIISKYFVMKVTFVWQVTSPLVSEASFWTHFRITAFPQVGSLHSLLAKHTWQNEQ